eukprot:scaffold9049_cov105-Isochrysis_galbana.AAC.3
MRDALAFERVRPPCRGGAGCPNSCWDGRRLTVSGRRPAGGGGRRVGRLAPVEEGAVGRLDARSLDMHVACASRDLGGEGGGHTERDLAAEGASAAGRERFHVAGGVAQGWFKKEWAGPERAAKKRVTTPNKTMREGPISRLRMARAARVGIVKIQPAERGAL